MNAAKEAAATYAARLVQDNMIIGLGSGSTAEIAVRVLGERRRNGLQFTGVATSEKTAALATSLGIPLVPLDRELMLNLTIDGADEVDPSLNLIKGHGGALLREKLVGDATRQYVIVVDETKLVDRLGYSSPIPVEIVPFAWQTTAARLRGLGFRTELRGGDRPYVTDGHNYILDCRLSQPEAGWGQIGRDIKLQTGVVEHGLFLGMASAVVVGYSDGRVDLLERPLH